MNRSSMAYRFRAGLSVGACFFLACAIGLALAGCGGDATETTGSLRVNTTPVSGAEVIVDGLRLGVTPAHIEGVSPGGVTVEVEKPGYKRNWRTVAVEAGRETQLTLEIEQLVGYLTIDSIPPGATVTVEDGQVLGETPVLSAAVPIGEHTYRVELANHIPVEKTLEVEQSYRYNFSHQLEPLKGQLMLRSKPNRASVWLNQMPQESKTPATYALAPGRYSVMVHAPGHVMAETVVTIEPNASREVELTMKEGNAPPGMILIPAGEFIFGVDGLSADERPQRKVNLPDYYLDKYEVTNYQYKAVFPTHTYIEGEEMHPVTGVSWEQANAFAKAVGKRLPTEMEWEKAARGKDGRDYPWGNVFDATVCSSGVGPKPIMKPVGSYLDGASPFGCMDMAGNAYEWTADWYQAYEGNEVIQQQYGQLFRVLRGGSIRSNEFDVRCARRHYDMMDSTRADYGFRCAADVD